MPVEIQMGNYADRFGVQGAFGRPLYLNEMREITIAENVEHAYRERKASGNWAEWTEKNPDMAAVLNRASHGE